MTNEAESGHLFLGHSHGFFSEVSVQFFLLMFQTGYLFFIIYFQLSFLSPWTDPFDRYVISILLSILEFLFSFY